MAEPCVVVRCVQERRILKRELQKWSKNVLYLVGLERVAEELIGHDKWTKVKPQSHLKEDELSKEVEDWNPNEDCCFCANRRQTESPIENEHVDMLIDDTADLDSPKPDSVCNSRPSSPSSPDSDQPLDLSLGNKPRPYLDSLFNGAEAYGSPALLKVPQVSDKSGKLKRRIEPTTTNCKRTYTDDELQAALRDIRSGKLGTRRAAVIYGIPRSTLRNKVYKLTLGDGGSGANPVDSPPRDSVTPVPLDDDLPLPDDSVTDVGDRGRHHRHHNHQSASASESLRQLLRNRMFDKPLPTGAKSTSEGLDPATQSLGPLLLSHMLASIQQQQKQRGDDDETTANDDDEELKLPLLPDLIRKLSEERFEKERHRHRPQVTAEDEGTGGGGVILKIPSYKPVKTVVGNGINNNNNNNEPSVAPVASTVAITTTAVATVVSSSQSNGNGGGETKASKGIGVTLREIIAKSITQRAHNKESKSKESKLATTESLLRPLAPAPSPTVLANGNAKRARVVDNHGVGRGSVTKTTMADGGTTTTTVKKESKNGGGGGSAKSSEKRVRPKRGRYRNYDRDNLVEAVRAVQRGEMSVHRAGSYYGVPHSTLEYKVKERHLLRPRKNRGGGNNNGSSKNANSDGDAAAPSSGGGGGNNNSKRHHSSSSDDDDMSDGGGQNSDASVTSRSKGTRTPTETVTARRGNRGDGTPSTTTTTLTGHASSVVAPATTSSSLWPSSPLFAVDFGGRLNSGNFFASQMMRKLQEDALTQSHGGGGGAGGTGGGAEHSLSSRDALLLGVLIRNGLQATEATAGK